MPDAPPLLKRLQAVHHSSLVADGHERLTLKFMPFRDVPFSPRWEAEGEKVAKEEEDQVAKGDQVAEIPRDGQQPSGISWPVSCDSQ